jgi:hypothetical protein
VVFVPRRKQTNRVGSGLGTVGLAASRSRRSGRGVPHPSFALFPSPWPLASGAKAKRWHRAFRGRASVKIRRGSGDSLRTQHRRRRPKAEKSSVLNRIATRDGPDLSVSLVFFLGDLRGRRPFSTCDPSGTIVEVKRPVELDRGAGASRPSGAVIFFAGCLGRSRAQRRMHRAFSSR